MITAVIADRFPLLSAIIRRHVVGKMVGKNHKINISY